MRKFLILLFAASILFACNNNKSGNKRDGGTVETDKKDSNAASTAQQAAAPTPAAVPNPYEKILGSFVGAFGNNKITMLITKATKDSVGGRTIVGGNDRPFTGTWYSGEGKYGGGATYFFTAKEPGDHKDDGEFNFVMSEDATDVVNGSWTPYNKSRPAKEYSLERKKFEYSTDVGDYPEASQRLLKPKDVENMMKEDLEFMRNEIFARHGFCFSKKYLRQQFEMQDWYVPNTVDIKGFLTDIEKKNIDMIKRYEKYADEYGDEYGR
jgi:YARHG domain